MAPQSGTVNDITRSITSTRLLQIENKSPNNDGLLSGDKSDKINIPTPDSTSRAPSIDSQTEEESNRRLRAETPINTEPIDQSKTSSLVSGTHLNGLSSPLTYTNVPNYVYKTEPGQYDESKMSEFMRLRIEEEKTKQFQFKCELSRSVAQLLKNTADSDHASELIKRLFFDESHTTPWLSLPRSRASLSTSVAAIWSTVPAVAPSGCLLTNIVIPEPNLAPSPVVTEAYTTGKKTPFHFPEVRTCEPRTDWCSNPGAEQNPNDIEANTKRHKRSREVFSAKKNLIPQANVQRGRGKTPFQILSRLIIHEGILSAARFLECSVICQAPGQQQLLWPETTFVRTWESPWCLEMQSGNRLCEVRNLH